MHIIQSSANTLGRVFQKCGIDQKMFFYETYKFNEMKKAENVFHKNVAEKPLVPSFNRVRIYDFMY